MKFQKHLLNWPNNFCFRYINSSENFWPADWVFLRCIWKWKPGNNGVGFAWAIIPFNTELLWYFSMLIGLNLVPCTSDCFNYWWPAPLKM
jgi:hypothetical protein